MPEKNISVMVSHTRLAAWIDLFILTIAACAGYVFMEWLFIVTMPSFLTGAPLVTKVLVLLEGTLALSTLSLVLLGVLFLVTWAAKFHPRLNSLFLKLGRVLPALILSCLWFLLIDNFTYTVFKFGIATSSGILRGLYGALLLALLVFAYRFMERQVILGGRYLPQKAAVIGAVVVGTAGIVLLSFGRSNGSEASLLGLDGKLPNILLIGSDGMNADNMSIYGYARETTPNITKFAKGALIVRNDFTNASNTSGSLIALLSSRYPTQTRVLFPPDILQGEDITRHLPGILKQAGYYTMQISGTYYADAFTWGMLAAFDEVNLKPASSSLYNRLVRLGFENYLAYFISSLQDRIASRIFHSLYIREMDNPYDLITKEETRIVDSEKISAVLKVFEEHRGQPVFVHAHLTGTHGSRFGLKERKFSAGLVQDRPWHPDFYDDSIYNFDILFGRLIDRLKRRGILENTIVILYSDHGWGASSIRRVPLIIKFPGVETEKYVEVGQNIDVAPTLLDYLGVPKPDWMMGTSLLQPRSKTFPIFSFATTANNLGAKPGAKGYRFTSDPPFYQFDYLYLTDCQKYYQLNLETYQWVKGEIKNFDGPCLDSDLLPPEQVKQLAIDRLTQDGFEMPAEIFEAEIKK